MPIFYVDESFDGRPVSTDVRSGRRLERQFYVRTDTPDVTWSGVVAASVLGNAGIMAANGYDPVYIGTPHPEWSAAFCSSIAPSPDPDDPSTFLIKVQYEEAPLQPGQIYGTAPSTGRPASPPEPEDQPPDVSLVFRSEQEFQFTDLDGKALKNTAGQPIQNPPPVLVPRAQLRFTVKKSDWHENIGLYIIGGVNNAEWRGRAKDTNLITGVEAKPNSKKGRAWWEITYTIEYNTKKWIPTQILNVGRMQKLEDGTVVVATDGTGRGGGTVERFLDADGLVSETPIYLDFRFYKRVDFNSL